MSLFMLSFAWAGQTVEGDALRISYYDTGNWAWGRAEAGVEALLNGEWVDFVWPGDAHHVLALSYDAGGSTIEHYADSFTGVSTMTVVAEQDLSTGAEAVAQYQYIAGDLALVKTESWDLSSATVTVELVLTNNGASDLTRLQLFVATDPDPDWFRTGLYDTNNDALDGDGDGVNEYAQSVGPSTGYTMGMGACDALDGEAGHYPDWITLHDAGQVFVDEGGALADDAMGLRLAPSVTLAPGQVWVGRLVVVLAEDPAEAWSRYEGALPGCGCDLDVDGGASASCGGDDCDDEDPGVSASASEIWYDGVDQNCDGNDADQDGDGAVSGPDCDDTNPGINPGAAEVCNEIDDNCNGMVDEGLTTTWYQDADGDTYGTTEISVVACAQPAGFVVDPGDCDDDDLSVNPGEPEVCDGADDNCNGRVDEGCGGDSGSRDSGGGDSGGSGTNDSSPGGGDSGSDSNSNKGEANPSKCGSEGSAGLLLLFGLGGLVRRRR